MSRQPSKSSTDPFGLLLANVQQEVLRIQSTESLLTDLASINFDEAQVRFRIDAAQNLAVALQKDRTVILRQISDLTGASLQGLNLTGLIAICPPAYKAKIYAAKQSLSRALYRAHRATGSAAILVNESLRLQQSVLSALMGISASDRYDATGSQPIDSGSTRMESRS